MKRRQPGWANAAAMLWIGGILLFTFAPLVIMLMMSFSDSPFIHFPPRHFSLRWFTSYFSDPAWIAASLRSLWIGAAVALLGVLLGVPASLAIQTFGRRLLGFTMLLVIAPIALPPIVLAVAMYLWFVRIGLSGSYAGLLAGHLIVALPFVILTCVAALRKLDPELPRAARSLGARPFRVFFTIVLPIIRPAVFAGALLAFLASFDDLLIALFIGSPAIETLPRRMWNGVRSDFDPTISAASAIVVLATALIALLLWGAGRAQPWRLFRWSKIDD